MDAPIQVLQYDTASESAHGLLHHFLRLVQPSVSTTQLKYHKQHWQNSSPPAIAVYMMSIANRINGKPFSKEDRDTFIRRVNRSSDLPIYLGSLQFYEHLAKAYQSSNAALAARFPQLQGLDKVPQTNEILTLDCEAVRLANEATRELAVLDCEDAAKICNEIIVRSA